MYVCMYNVYTLHIFMYVGMCMCVFSYDMSMISGVDTGNFTVDHSTHYLMRGIKNNNNKS